MSGSHDPRDLSHTLSHSALAAHTHTHTHAERKLKAERRENPKKRNKGRKEASARTYAHILLQTHFAERNRGSLKIDSQALSLALSLSRQDLC